MRKRKYTKEYLLPFVKQSTNYTDLLTKLGLKITGGIHRLITCRIKEYEIDVSHFTGCGWSRGKTKDSDERIKNQSFKMRMSHEDVFCKNSGYSTSKLYSRLIELGWKNECYVCKINDWIGRPIRLHVDHKNGNHSDNRLENLRFLCPNCHQQTDTWGAKNKTS